MVRFFMSPSSNSSFFGGKMGEKVLGNSVNPMIVEHLFHCVSEVRECTNKVEKMSKIKPNDSTYSEAMSVLHKLSQSLEKDIHELNQVENSISPSTMQYR